MRIKVKLKFLDNSRLPMHHHYWLQSLLYRLMDEEIAARVHDVGFDSGGRIFRLFTFSRLLGPYELSKDKQYISFPHGCEWIISSPLDELLGSVANGMLRSGCLDIGSSRAEVREIVVENPQVQNESVQVRTLSPVVAYSTMTTADGRKYTVYFQPGETEFQRLVHSNLEKKINAIYSGETNIGKYTGVDVERFSYSKQENNPLQVRLLGSPRLHILDYKGVAIKGYSGTFELRGHRSLLRMAVEAGLGSKNAQGFGCLEVICQ